MQPVDFYLRTDWGISEQKVFQTIDLLLVFTSFCHSSDSSRANEVIFVASLCIYDPAMPFSNRQYISGGLRKANDQPR